MGKAIKKTFFGGAEKEAGRAQQEGFQLAGAKLGAAGQEVQDLFQPFVGPGQKAFDIQAAQSGALGREDQQRAFQQFTSSPGQQFLQQRAERSLLRNASAIGGLGGGNIRQALQAQAIGLAQQDFGNQFNRLGAITDIGRSALGQQASGIQFGATGQAQGLIGAGEAKAGGITGQAAAIRTFIESKAKAAGQAAGGGFG